MALRRKSNLDEIKSESNKTVKDFVSDDKFVSMSSYPSGEEALFNNPEAFAKKVAESDLPTNISNPQSYPLPFALFKGYGITPKDKRNKILNFINESTNYYRDLRAKGIEDSDGSSSRLHLRRNATQQVRRNAIIMKTFCATGGLAITAALYVILKVVIQWRYAVNLDININLPLPFAFSPLWRYAVGKEYIRFIANLAYKKKKIDKNNQKNKK